MTFSLLHPPHSKTQPDWGLCSIYSPRAVPHQYSCRDVVAVGAAVRSLVVGDRVALEPGVPCWSNMLPR